MERSEKGRAIRQWFGGKPRPFARTVAGQTETGL